MQLASSKLKTAIVKVLKDEGYVADFLHQGRTAARPTVDHRAEEYYDKADHGNRPDRARLAVPACGSTAARMMSCLQVLGGMGTVIVSTPKACGWTGQAGPVDRTGPAKSWAGVGLTLGY